MMFFFTNKNKHKIRNTLERIHKYIITNQTHMEMQQNTNIKQINIISQQTQHNNINYNIKENINQNKHIKQQTQYNNNNIQTTQHNANI